MSQSLVVTLGYTFSIVIAELISFYLIQKNVDEQEGILSYKLFLSIFLLGVIITFSFRQILLNGTNIPIANLYWILFSQLGAIIMAYFAFNQKIQIKDWIAIIFLFVYVIITFYDQNSVSNEN